jgi:NSS family neurotransmitter:Na+ symporter
MEKAQWSSGLMLVLACIGSAVGVGNIWRFPYLAAQNGGGTFVLAYVICIVLFGLPLLMLELLAGRTLASSPLAAFAKIKKEWGLFYKINFALVLIIVSYYVVVTGWTLGYLAFSTAGVLQPFSYFGDGYISLIMTLAVLALLFLVMRLKVREGLEGINKLLVPVLFVLLLGLALYSFSLSGFGSALAFLTTFDMAKLASPSLWVIALSQAFFSLSLGQGIMMAYGAYAPKKTCLSRSSIAIIAADTSVSLLACLSILTFVFTFSIPLDSGPALSFEALPAAFQQMPFGGILMPLFFLLMFSAAITSAVSLVEIVIMNFEDAFKVDRKKATKLAIGVVFLLMIPSALSYSPLALSVFGERVLDFLDVQVVGRFLPLSAAILVIYIAWGWKGLERSVSENIVPALAPLFMFSVRYAIPAVLLALSALQFLK